MKAYVITATATTGDDRRAIASGQTVYGAAYHWVSHINGSKWYENRQDAVEIIVNAHDERRDFLLSGSIATTNWMITQISYDLSTPPIDDAERDEVIRRNALKRLSADDRRVLGITI